MKKFLAGFLFALLAPASAFAQASGGAPISPTPGFGPSQLMNIVLGQTPLAGAWTASNCLTVSASGPPYYVAQASCGAGGGMSINGPVTGGTAGQGLYVAAGPVLAQFAYGAGVFTAMQVAADTTGGVVLLNGTPTSGDLLQWSATGAQDSNVAASSVVTLGATQTLTNKTLTSPAFTGTVTGAGTIPVGVISATGTPSSTTFLRGDGTWNAGSGGITGPGTTVVGNIATWNSTTGAAIADSGISVSGGGNINLPSSHSMLQGGVNLGTVGSSTNPFYGLYSEYVFLNAGGTGTDQILTGNASATSRTITIPAGTVNDTLAMIGATQTFSGANTFSGTVAHSGATTFYRTTLFSGSAPTMTANTTSIIGGSTSPTYPASTSGVLTFGGLLSAAPTLNSAGSGAVYSTTSGGLTFSGSGSSNDYTFNSHTGSSLGSISSAGLWSMNNASTGSIANSISTHVWVSGTAPTVTSGFGTVQGSIGTVNGTLRFDVNTNVGITGATGVVGLTAATTDWMCKAQSKNNAATLQVIQTGYATASATFAPYTLAGVSSAWIAADVIAISCVAN